jgi:hypothetical protein
MLDIKLLYPVSRKEKVRNTEALLKCFFQLMANARQKSMMLIIGRKMVKSLTLSEFHNLPA